ncbi:MAG: galactosyldiacylglycerol synthase [Herminiimonas sp.]|nr:galactosyldiacylglycerol synthase [Herminiimonas sp.]
MTLGTDFRSPRRTALNHAAPSTLPTLLVLSVSAGGGHVRAAQALCAAAAALPINALHVDAMQFVPAAFRRVYTDAYIGMVARFPRVWGWLYQHMQQVQPTDRTQSLRRRVERLLARGLLRKIAAVKPDMILCTHFLPAELLAHLPAERARSCPVWVQITDYDAHRMWIQPGIAGYFVGSEEVAFRLRAEGVAAECIHVTGLPVMPAFAVMPQREACARRLGLDPVRPTVLMMGGGAGLGNLAELAERILAIDPALQLIALSGRNTGLQARLAQIAARAGPRFLVHGHTAHVERFMACADLIVTKSGGLTSAECLAAALPMVINAPIPGQEERNADYLVEQGVALKAIDPVTVEYRVRHLLAHPDLRRRMAQQARAIARPDAAAAVLRTVCAQFAATADDA